jgi:hypothetical protein
MDPIYVPLLSALTGAIIGSLSSIATNLIQAEWNIDLGQTINPKQLKSFGGARVRQLLVRRTPCFVMLLLA